MIAVTRRVAELPTYTKRSPSPAELVARKQTPKPFVTSTPPTSPLRDVAFPTDAAGRGREGEREPALLSNPLGRFEQVAPQVFALTVGQVDAALQQEACQPLTETREMFPWLHGIHKDNWAQRDFFRWHDKVDPSPPSTYRGIALVHVGRPTQGVLDGAISADDLLQQTRDVFVDLDAVHGVSLRNFHTQQIKCAFLSDLVLYTNSDTKEAVTQMLVTAQRLVRAQQQFRKHWQGEAPIFNVFVIEDTFPVIERQFPHLIAVMRDGAKTAMLRDFVKLEQLEMRKMSRTSEISANLFLGCDTDWEEDSQTQANGLPPPHHFGIHIKCEDYVAIPSIRNQEIRDSGHPNDVLECVFPSSGCLTSIGPEEEQDLLDFCDWLYKQTHAQVVNATAAETPMPASTVYGGVLAETNGNNQSLPADQKRRVLLTCKDGYTETSLLALCYLVYAEGIPLDRAFLKLHCDQRRNFYCFSDDVATLQLLEPLLLNASPKSRAYVSDQVESVPRPWFQSSVGKQFSGNLPSRIMDHLYLGNLEHADNLAMLQALGITRLLSVGEHPAWQMRLETLDTTLKPTAHLWVRQIQDDGIDPLAEQIEKCLAFIEEGYQLGQRTLVHCRVGVSRSASICIADVVRRLGLALPEAYLMVRARRLNVIIQPNLRFMYELLDWTQQELTKRQMRQGEAVQSLVPRNMTWPALAARIAALNRHYISGSG